MIRYQLTGAILFLFAGLAFSADTADIKFNQPIQFEKKLIGVDCYQDSNDLSMKHVMYALTTYPSSRQDLTKYKVLFYSGLILAIAGSGMACGPFESENISVRLIPIGGGIGIGGFGLCFWSNKFLIHALDVYNDQFYK
jgi:hypothetical protein